MPQVILIVWALGFVISLFYSFQGLRWLVDNNKTISHASYSALLLRVVFICALWPATYVPAIIAVLILKKGDNNGHSNTNND